MTHIKFKKIYQLLEQLQEKYYKEDYNELLKTENNIGTLDEFISKSKKDNHKTKTDKSKINDSIILKDTIVKQNITFNLYLFHYIHTKSPELDDNYDLIPLIEERLFQYGCVVTLDDADGSYDIRDVFAGIETNEDNAKVKYEELKNKITNSTEDELLDEIEKVILGELGT